MITIFNKNVAFNRGILHIDSSLAGSVILHVSAPVETQAQV